MKTDPRMLFIIRAVHCITVCGDSLEADEVDGLKMVLESIVIDGREKP